MRGGGGGRGDRHGIRGLGGLPGQKSPQPVGLIDQGAILLAPKDEINVLSLQPGKDRITIPFAVANQGDARGGGQQLTRLLTRYEPFVGFFLRQGQGLVAARVLGAGGRRGAVPVL